MNRLCRIAPIGIALAAVAMLSCCSAPPLATRGSAASSPAATRPAYPLWDGKESVPDYAKRAGIRDAQIDLKLDANVSLKLTLIPAGRFIMGSTWDESRGSRNDTPHAVTLTSPFYMAVYEITQAQYLAVTGKDDSCFKGPDLPVAPLSYNEAAEFCRKASARTGRTIQMPTEAQWEYACRAGTTGPFHTGTTLEPDQANFDPTCPYGNSRKGQPRQTTLAVGSFKPNSFGLYDMHGNVYEFCTDWYDLADYAKGDATDPAGAPAGRYRIVRGGGANTTALQCRNAYRAWYEPAARGGNFGIRIIMPIW